MRRSAVLLLLCAMFLLLPPCRNASAQEQTQERVVVTGTEIDDPAAAVLELAPRDLELVEVLNRSVPNVAINNAGGNSFNDVWAIRGIGNTPNFSKTAVPLYIDDVPSGSTFTNFPLLLGASRVEIFRGPHGERFGRNSEGGVINIVVDPPQQRARASASVQLGSYDLFGAQAHASGPMIDERLFGSFTFSHLQRDGFLHNALLDTHPDDINQSAARLALRFTPSEAWKIDLVSEFHHSDDGVQRFVPLDSGDPFRVAFDFDGRTRINGDVQAVKISHESDAGRWLSITSRRDWRLHPYEADFDYSPARIVRGRFDLRQLQLAQELRYESLQLGRFSWRAGAFVARTSMGGAQVYASPGYLERITFDEIVWEAALFGHVNIALNQQLQLTIGLRVEHVDDEIERQRVASFQPPTAFTGARSEWNTQPKLALEYKAADALTFYGSTAYGYKAGGFSYLQTDPRFASFGTERVLANEIGVRAGELKTRRWEARAAVFRNVVWHYQVERLANFPDITIFNAPEVHSWGAEAEAKLQLLPGWDVTAAFGYTRSEFEEFRDPLTGVSYAGNRTPFAPEFTASFSSRYTSSIGVFAEAGVTAAGETFYDEANSSTLREPPHAQVNARMGYEKQQFSVAVFGENLNDARYFTQKIGYAGIGTPGPPRTFGGMVTVQF